eukprot:408746-Pelagomonas_calceolata.AAC.1
MVDMPAEEFLRMFQEMFAEVMGGQKEIKGRGRRRQKKWNAHVNDVLVWQRSGSLLIVVVQSSSSSPSPAMMDDGLGMSWSCMHACASSIL